MMMLPDKKKTVSVILAKLGKPGMPDEKQKEIMGDEPMMDSKMAMIDSAKKMMEAVKLDKPELFMQHLIDFIDLKEECCEKED
jgi:hypothetical protein